MLKPINARLGDLFLVKASCRDTSMHAKFNLHSVPSTRPPSSLSLSLDMLQSGQAHTEEATTSSRIQMLDDMRADEDM